MKKSIILGVVSLILAFIYAGVSGGNLTDPYGIGTALGGLIGAFGIAGVLVLLVAGVYWVFKRKRMPNIHTTVWVLCIILLVLSIAGGLAKIVSTSQQVDPNAAKAIESISQIANRLDDEKFDEDGYVREAETTIESQTETSGVWGEIEKFYRDNAEQERKMNNAYVRALDALDWDNLLNIERLADDIDLAKSRHAVSQAKREVELYSSRHATFLDSLPDKVTNIDFGSTSKNEDFMKGFAEKLSLTKNQSAELWSYEKQVLELCEQIIFFLYDSQGSWSIENDQFLFEADEQVDVYNGYINELQLVAERQQNLMMKMRLQQKKQLEKAQNVVN